MKLILLKQAKKAFTLIEIITVLFVVSLGLVGVLSLIIQNIQAQSLNKNSLMATQLAQEGIELVRKTRDTNWRKLPPNRWKEGLTGPSLSFYMDYTDSVPHPLVAPIHMPLYLDGDGFYKHSPISIDSSDPSIFSRLITIRSSGSMLQVISDVSWQDRDKTYFYSVTTYLYGWF